MVTVEYTLGGSKLQRVFINLHVAFDWIERMQARHRGFAAKLV